MDSYTLPRVVGSNLGDYYGKPVILIGEVMNNNNGLVVLKAADGMDIYVGLPPGQVIESYVITLYCFAYSPILYYLLSYTSTFIVLLYSKFIQVIGKVNQKNSLEAHAVQTVSENFDLELYAKTLKVCTSDSYKALFA